VAQWGPVWLSGDQCGSLRAIVAQCGQVARCRQMWLSEDGFGKVGAGLARCRRV
jgi:hypothetical protein